MTPDVVTVDPETDLASIAKILIRHRISAVIVADEHDHVLGIVSESDLMRSAKRDPGRGWWLSLVADRGAKFVHREGVRAKDIMTQDVICTTKDASLSEIARLLESNHVKRVPVLEGGQIAGVVSRADVLQGLAALRGREEEPTIEDLNIRMGIVELVKRRGGVSMQSVNVVVLSAEVFLWGIVEDDEDRVAVGDAAEALVGSGKVHNFLSTLPEVARGLRKI
ncbi:MULTISPECIES: CBS domain-containing protein [Methyloceanibacter]|uniref:CBS domain-containing protein n=1 Tax=Methyloceanibacter TaxID=1484898 RepID=UPI00131F03DC|nr:MULTISPECIES: CBS domain-containing protein [Methyloceanibacter]